jgi:predicted dehydrogenase
MSCPNALKVLIIGFGFMGENHFNNLKELEKDGRIHVSGVIDNDPSKLLNKKLASIASCCFASIEKAYENNNYYDVVVVVTNTVTHNDIIKELFKCSVNQINPPALFIEKPLVENTTQAKETVNFLYKMGYGSTLPFTCGYLFRESPALDKCIKYIQENGLKIQKVRTVWQKLRDTKRPSAGVHIDEATHPVDVLINYLFPVLGLSNKDITLKISKRDYSKSIVNQELQAKFYGSDHVPLATVDYLLSVGGIPIEGHSSFMEGPQRREIWLKCDKDTDLKIAFDDNKTDNFTINISGKNAGYYEFKDPNKLMLEWKTFLQSCQMKYEKSSSAKNFKIPSLQDTLIDINITEALGNLEIGKEHSFQFEKL